MGRLLCKLTAAAFAIVAPLSSQNDQTRAVELKIRNVLPFVNVVMELSTATQQVVFPYCGEFPRTPILCVQNVTLEVRTPEGWSAAKLRTRFGVLGGSPSLGTKALVPGSRTSVAYEFSRRWWEIEVGQELRLVVDVWPDEQ